MADKFLDLKGLPCPIPIVKIDKAIKEIEVGQTIEAVVSDPGVLADIPIWCKSTGNQLVEMGKGDTGTYNILIRRTN
jgi:tRNA 2-thiouridine synthesizing protein A